MTRSTKSQGLSLQGSGLRHRVKYLYRDATTKLASFPKKSLYKAKMKWLFKSTTPLVSFLDLPFELRLGIYELICEPQSDGSVPGVLHVLLLNRQIYHEARPIFDTIPHKIVLADIFLFLNAKDVLGSPRTTNLHWHHSIKRLILVVSVHSLGIMTPERFNINVSPHSKCQWKGLATIIGVWPFVRDNPLEELHVQFRRSRYRFSPEVHCLNLMSILRTYKRTRVWAELSEPKRHDSPSLLPLVKTFNQARGSWVRGSTTSDNQRVNIRKNEVSKGENPDKKQEQENQKWSIVPTEVVKRFNKTNAREPTHKERFYMDQKMIERGPEPSWQCGKCMATFNRRKQWNEHLAREDA